MKVIDLARVCVLRVRQTQLCRQHSFCSKSWIDSLQQPETLDQKSRSDHEHHCDADLKHHEHLTEAQATSAGNESTTRLFECCVQVRFRGVPRGNESEDQARRERYQHSESEHAPVKTDLREARNTCGYELQQQLRARGGNRESCDRAEERKQQPFEKELSYEPRSTCTKRGANRDLFVSSSVLGEQQSGNVRTRDQQYESDRSEQRKQCRSHVADDLVHKPVNDDSLAAILRVLLFETRGDRVHLSRRLLERDSGFEPCENTEHVCGAHRRPLRRERHRRPVLLLLFVKRNVSGRGGPYRIDPGGHDADNGVACAIECDAVVDDVPVAA